MEGKKIGNYLKEVMQIRQDSIMLTDGAIQ